MALSDRAINELNLPPIQHTQNEDRDASFDPAINIVTYMQNYRRNGKFYVIIIYDYGWWGLAYLGVRNWCF